MKLKWVILFLFAAFFVVVSIFSCSSGPSNIVKPSFAPGDTITIAKGGGDTLVATIPIITGTVKETHLVYGSPIDPIATFIDTPGAKLSFIVTKYCTIKEDGTLDCP